MRDAPPAEALSPGESRQRAARAAAPEDAFRAWFGDSQVVDDSGRPLVLYHGTAADFASFSGKAHRTVLNREYQGDGFFFSESADVASEYADANRNQSINKERAFELADKNLPPLAARTFKAVVNDGYLAAWQLPEAEVAAILEESRVACIDLTDLLDVAEYIEGSNYHKGRGSQPGPIDIFGRWHHSLPEWVRDSAVKFGLEDALPSPAVMPVYLKAEKVLRTDDPVAARNAQANGYDGVYYTGEGTVRGEPEWIVYRPEQIKSAIGNSGRFDPRCPDITDGAAHAHAMTHPPCRHGDRDAG